MLRSTKCDTRGGSPPSWKAFARSSTARSATVTRAKHFDEYAEEARQGHNILIVHATEPGILEKVQPILNEHQAHHGRHYGRWTVTYLC